MSRKYHPGTWFLTGFIKVTGFFIMFSYAIVDNRWDEHWRRKTAPQSTTKTTSRKSTTKKGPTA